MSSQKIVAIIFFFGLFALMAAPVPASAALQKDSWKGYGITEGGTFGTEVGLGKRDVKATVGDIINIVLGVLGIIAVVMIVAGGVMWMTAGGNEDKVGQGKKIIMQGAVGLAIIFAAWGIARFVISQLSEASTDVVKHCSNAVTKVCDANSECIITTQGGTSTGTCK